MTVRKKVSNLPNVVNHVVTSVSMPAALQHRLALRLPRYGDRSKLITRMIELWLGDELHVPGLRLRSIDEAQDLELIALEDL